MAYFRMLGLVFLPCLPVHVAAQAGAAPTPAPVMNATPAPSCRLDVGDLCGWTGQVDCSAKWSDYCTGPSPFAWNNHDPNMTVDEGCNSVCRKCTAPVAAGNLCDWKGWGMASCSANALDEWARHCPNDPFPFVHDAANVLVENFCSQCTGQAGAAPTPAPMMPAPTSPTGVADLAAFLKIENFNASSCAASARTDYDYLAMNRCFESKVYRNVGRHVFVDRYLNSNCTGPYATTEYGDGSAGSSTSCFRLDNEKYGTSQVVSLPYVIFEIYSNSSCAGTLQETRWAPVGVCSEGGKMTCDAGIATEIKYEDELCTHGATQAPWTAAAGGCLIVNGTPTPYKMVACTEVCVPFITAVEDENSCEQCTSFPCVWEPCSAKSPRVCSSTEADQMGALAI